MICLPPYIYDKDAYPRVAVKDRWIFNKLILAEQLGYKCGPTGMRAPAGTYCVRPIYNLQGSGRGGFYKIKHDGNRNIPSRPGYFWSEWFDGEQGWIQFVNDVSWFGSKYTLQNGELLGVCKRVGPDYFKLPFCLTDLSLYLVIETIGGKIIEASPRLLTENARHEMVAFHRENYDSAYAPTDLLYGSYTWRQVLTGDGGFTWETVPGSRKPY